MIQQLRKTLAILGATLMLSIVPAVALPVAAHADTIGDCLSQGSDLSGRADPNPHDPHLKARLQTVFAPTAPTSE